MLSHLLFYLLFETAMPSYGTFASFLPQEIIVSAANPTLAVKNAPIKKGESIGPVLQAKSVYSVDLTTGTPLIIKDVFSRRPIASIAKLVTAMVILDSHSLNEKIVVSANASFQEGSKMWLSPGEEISVQNLLTGMLIASGNDAAVALAEFNSGSEDAFVIRMNEKAHELKLKNTHFSNAKGFDEEENYSTAFDTMIFGRAALNYPFIKKTVGIKTTEVKSTSGKIKHSLQSTNELLGNKYFNVIGLKTGRTPAAGQSFVSLAKGPNNHEILTVLLDSPDRFKETKIAIDWTLRNFLFP